MEPADSAKISPLALTVMLLHAQSHPTEAVHGFLVGTTKGTTVQVSEAFPVCHETPTKPLVESAVALALSTLELAAVENNKIVGWYTSPELLGDSRPDPVALRIVASLEAESGTSVFVKLDPESQDSQSVLQAFSKDFGKQWLNKIPVTIESQEAATKAAQSKDVAPFQDLVDLWLQPTTKSTEWPLSTELKSAIQKAL